MTATEELRRLLDERGAEWTYGYGTVSYKSDGHWCNAWEYGNGMMCVSMGFFTPEQAIAATLGQGTCEMEYVSDFMSWHCKSCDMMDMAPRNPKPRFCKWCGRKVVDPTTNDVDVEVDA